MNRISLLVVDILNFQFSIWVTQKHTKKSKKMSFSTCAFTANITCAWSNSFRTMRHNANKCDLPDYLFAKMMA